MFEAKLSEGYVFKKIIESIKDVVNEVNLEITPNGKCIIILQSNSSLFSNLILCFRYLIASNGLIACCTRRSFPEL